MIWLHIFYIFKAFNLMSWCPLWHGPTYNKQIEKKWCFARIYSFFGILMSIFLSFGEGFSEWKIFLFFIFASPLYVFSRSMEDVKKSRKGSSYQEFCTFCYLNKYCGTQIRHQSIFIIFFFVFTGLCLYCLGIVTKHILPFSKYVHIDKIFSLVLWSKD